MLRALLAALLLVFSWATAAQAQDLLTRRNGEEIQAKILEITPEVIKYRRTDNPDGPLISVLKSEVFMIRYANGTHDILNPVPGIGAAPAGAVTSQPLGAVPGSPVVPGDEFGPGEPVHLGGPRLGFTVLAGGVLDKARQHEANINPFLTQFGWQFESRLFRLPNGVSGLVELVPLVGGVEQGLFIPSISGLLGVRGPGGFEFGLGPNVTPLGSNIVLALGTSFRSNGINFPVNLAVVPGNGGARISLLIGFNSRRN
jgi:hypothetical protein